MALYVDGVIKVELFCDYCNIWKSITRTTSKLSEPLNPELIYDELKTKLIKKGWKISNEIICPSCI